MNELVEIAIVAYRAGRHRDAIELLLQVTDNEAHNWLARLYLAMAYEKTGRSGDAHRLLKRLAEDCPDVHIRQKAGDALPLVEAEMRKRFKQVNHKQKNVDLSDDIVWIANEKY